MNPNDRGFRYSISAGRREEGEVFIDLGEVVFAHRTRWDRHPSAGESNPTPKLGTTSVQFKGAAAQVPFEMSAETHRAFVDALTIYRSKR